MKSMQPDLHDLVHYFNDRRYLFETITMAAASQVDDICDVISSQKGWYCVRYSASERQQYLKMTKIRGRSDVRGLHAGSW